MGRISRQAMYIGMARMASQRSTCCRLNVGTIITFHDSPVSIGWNGAESGAPHCSGNLCAGMEPGKCPTIHAEDNGLKKAVSLLSPGSRIDLYSTHSPCKSCTIQIMRCELHVKRVFFEFPYRNNDHLEMLISYWGGPLAQDKRETKVYEVTPAGYVVDYYTRRIEELP